MSVPVNTVFSNDVWVVLHVQDMWFTLCPIDARKLGELLIKHSDRVAQAKLDTAFQRGPKPEGEVQNV